MSRYVKRCQGAWCNRRVHGVSSFRLITKGHRSDVCKFCEQQDRAEGIAPIRHEKLAVLLRREHALENQLVRLRNRIKDEQQRQSA